MKIINNAGFDKNNTKVLKTEKSFIYKVKDKEDWKYSHHQFLAFFKGRFYAMWSSGRIHEEFPGQRVMISSSEDAMHWEKPKVLLDVKMGEHIEGTLTAAGFYVYEGKLNAYIGYYEYQIDCMLSLGHALALKGNVYDNSMDMFPTPTHRNVTMLIMTSDDGMDFSAPINTKFPVIPNYSPQILKSGRLLISGNVMFPFTDDPHGISGWHKTGIYPDSMADTIFDDSEGLEIVKNIQGWPTHYCEGSFFQMPDGIINMLLRTGMLNNNSFLYCTRSEDNGENWSAPFKTEFSNDTSKFHFGILPDGRYYYVGNPVVSSGRCPLAISLSKNGIDFDDHYIIENQNHIKLFEGMYKGGVYGYPHTLIHEDRMYIIYSLNKESVAISSFLLNEL